MSNLQKTPITQAIEYIDSYISLQRQSESNDLNYAALAEDFRNVLESLLPTERTAIKAAYWRGFWNATMSIDKGASDYFTQTYLSQSEAVEQTDEEYVRTSGFPVAECVHFVEPVEHMNYCFIIVGGGNSCAISNQVYDEQSAWSAAADRIRKQKENM